MPNILGKAINDVQGESMNVAKLELCKDLYDLSGWEPEDWYELDPDGKPEEYFCTSEDRLMSPDGEYVAAYDLGYLLRKLPDTITNLPHSFLWRFEMQKMGDGYTVGFGNYMWVRDNRSVFKRKGMSDEVIDDLVFWHEPQYSDTPEDATCKLAIELFKQGILVKEDQPS